MGKDEAIQATAGARRRIAIDALGTHLDATSATSSAARMRVAIESSQRPMVVSADIDGLVSAAMLASVAPGWETVALVSSKVNKVWVHPTVAEKRPADIFGVDVFSPMFDNVSNHVVTYGSKKLQVPEVLEALREWDDKVSSSGRLLAVPSVWARTEAGHDEYEKPTSAKYKYPFGTAQILLALLEAAGRPPKFYDRHFLPWLVANCDGGVTSYAQYAWNASIWWATLAGAVGPASLTEQVYKRVSEMSPLEFMSAVNQLDRERGGEPRWLDDKWNLVDDKLATVERTIGWLGDLTGWRDPMRGGVGRLSEWVELDVPVTERGVVTLTGANSDAKKDPVGAAESIAAAERAVNANFYIGGQQNTTRFNWIGGW